MKRNAIKWILFSLLLSLFLTACAGEKEDHGYSLTEEQQASFQSATSHLIRREGDNEYYVQYANCGAELKDGRLKTFFDGRGAAVNSPAEGKIFPVLDMHDGQGDVVNCTGIASLSNENENAGWYGLVQIDKNQSTASLLGMSPRAESTPEQLLAGEYGPVQDLSSYSRIFFWAGVVYNINYGEDGKPLPISQWTETTKLIGYDVFDIAESELEYTPLVDGEFYVLYEITDTDGNVYCSDLIPYETERTPPREDIREPEVFAKWEKGAREQLLLSQNGIDIYLTVVKGGLENHTYYSIKARNNTEETIEVFAKDLIVNGNVYCGEHGSIKVDPGKFVAGEYFDTIQYGIADGSPELETIVSLQLALSVTKGPYIAKRTLVEETIVQVDMTDAWIVDREYTDSFHMTQPVMDALAQEQVLWEDEKIRLHLVGAGLAKYEDNLRLVFRVENLTPYAQHVRINGAAVNNAYMEFFCDQDIPGNCIAYMYEDISADELENATNPSIESLRLRLEWRGDEAWIAPPYQHEWVPVTLAQSGTAEPFDQGELLWECAEAQVGLREYDWDWDRWILTLKAKTDQEVCLRFVDAETGERVGGEYNVGPGQYGIAYVRNPAPSEDTFERIPYKVRLQIYTFDGKTLLAECPEVIILK